MIVSIGVFAIFAGFVIAALNPFEQFKKTLDSKRKSDLAQIQRALEAYYQDYGRYPENSPNYRIQIESDELDWGDSWAPYIDVLPIDPSDYKTYIYVADANNSQQSYWMYTSLDRGVNDPEICNSDGSSCSNVPDGINCGVVCNYGVSSPNVSP